MNAGHTRRVSVIALDDRASPRVFGAALAVALSDRGRAGVVLVEHGPGRRRPLLAGERALEIERSLAAGPGEATAAGRFCALAVAATDPAPELGAAGADWIVDARGEPGGNGPLVAVAELPRQRSLAALAAIEARDRGRAVAVVPSAGGPLAARRALAGLDPGGSLAARAERLAARLRRLAGAQGGQALPLALAIGIGLVVLAAMLAALGASANAGSRLQRAADLAAVSAARSMRDDHARLFVAATRGDGSADPAHLSRSAYLARARESAIGIAVANGAARARVSVSFPDGGSIAPVRARVEVRGRISGTATSAVAEAVAVPVVPAPPPLRASGGGYAGPLDYRQGVPMRPDVATAFDRMARAAAVAGVAIEINSGFRSDAEQARLFAANPDPRWVAPPGRSLHRCATELDLGPPAAYAWLAANAPAWGFERRYGWEPWHFGYVAGPAPCTARAERRTDGTSAGAAGLPGWVPVRFRGAIAAAAMRHDIAAAVLAAQLLAESGFNPFAVSPAGARGIAQFMPATASAYGLDDPYDPFASIDAQARLMADLLASFGRLELALAAYNAGPGAVTRCGCTDPYPETAAYVARILGLLGGSARAGIGPAAPAGDALEVRLTR